MLCPTMNAPSAFGHQRMSVTVARAGSVLTLILAFAAVAALLRRPFVRPGRVLLSVPLLVLAFALSGAGSHSMRLLVGALGVAPVVHQAHAGPLILACVFAALAAFALCLVFLLPWCVCSSSATPRTPHTVQKRHPCEWEELP